METDYQKNYKQSFFKNETFEGYITLLSIENVSEPLYIQYNEKEICIANDGFIWLQHFPTNERYSLTTMFNSKGEIVQWYIDICYKNGIENGVPWLDDLFLDIVVLPDGEIFLIDIDELENALNLGIIDKSLYNLAWSEAKKIKDSLDRGKFELITLSKEHRNYLLNR